MFSHSVFDLTEREIEVLDLMAHGRNNLAIAKLLVIQIRTVERHITAIFDKLQLKGDLDIHPRVMATLIYFRAKVILEGPAEELKKAHEQIMADVLG